MGMRFRKSVSLGKGARINFGKSGMSLTVGGRGASTTFSKRGVYSNLSIPGTGISYQTKIAGPSKSSSDSSSSRTASGNAAPPNPERARALEIMQSHTDPKDGLLLRVELTDTGEIIFKFKDTVLQDGILSFQCLDLVTPEKRTDTFRNVSGYARGCTFQLLGLHLFLGLPEFLLCRFLTVLEQPYVCS